MDDYLVSTAIFLILGLATLFLSSVLANHSREVVFPEPVLKTAKNFRDPRFTKNDPSSEKNQTEPPKYEVIISRYADRINPFSQLESFFYILAALSLGYTFHFALWWFVIASAVLLIGILALRTLVYSLGIRYANGTFQKAYPLISLIASVTAPFASLIGKVKLAVGGQSEAEDSRDEIETLVDSAKEEGSLDDSEYRLLKNIMNFSDVLVSDVMTPRTVVFSLPETTTVGDCIRIREVKNYSRIPIYAGDSLDVGVKGYVTARDILAAYAEGKTDHPLSDFSRKIHFIPDNLELSRALEQFLVTQQHMYIVVDEYGGVDGLITMEDLLETILGVEIVDEADTITDLRKLAKKTRDYRQKKKRG